MVLGTAIRMQMRHKVHTYNDVPNLAPLIPKHGDRKLLNENFGVPVVAKGYVYSFFEV